MRRFTLGVAVLALMLASCAPVSSEPGGIRVDGSTDSANILAVERECRGVELFPAGWSQPGNPWIRRCR